MHGFLAAALRKPRTPRRARPRRLATELALLLAWGLVPGLAFSLSGCALDSAPALQSADAQGFGRTRLAAAPPGGPRTDRQIIRTADLRVEVDDLEQAGERATAAVTSRDGFVESSYEAGEESLRLQFRVPAAALDGLLTDLEALGRVKHASVSSYDVTEQHADLKVRLANDVKLRDRLRQLLERASTVEEILAVEKELARVQTEVEALQGQLERLESQVSLSSVTLTLERKRILGPLGYLGYGIYWVVEKLFVIR